MESIQAIALSISVLSKVYGRAGHADLKTALLKYSLANKKFAAALLALPLSYLGPMASSVGKASVKSFTIKSKASARDKTFGRSLTPCVTSRKGTCPKQSMTINILKALKNFASAACDGDGLEANISVALYAC